ncbi:hypothetical protein DWB79_07690 [Treponema medium]|uniref:Right handed beta helix domain-containing protein n=2 Tax=Treponema medium TaxID=58231 RepID=A0AA87NR42_TREMD|nr:InlB B-repeat-containing protein [Treponema medium]EPF28309.1 hypothetical protein HMPREF9195_01518 [Treponema medium ATCC 700293]QSH97626.1 hypothetical protein DWB79_07690 [Treponema medium]
MKKIVQTVILSVLAFCFFIACKNYTADIDDDLSYWSTEASIAGYAFDTVTQTDAEGMQCVPSKAAVTVTFTLRNPKNFHFRMPGDSDAPADIITFPQTQNTSDKRAAAPQSGNDYEFKKISNTKLTLTYNPAFLQKYEWGSEAITPAITLYTTDGRAFKQTVPFGLTVNTPPPAIDKCVIAQTKTASSSETSYYVLCLQLSDGDMKERCSNGLLHEDIVGIEIAGIPYSLSVDNVQKQLKAQNGSYFIDKGKVKKLAPPDAENIPSDWTLYFKTDVKVMPGSAKKDYTIRLKDAKGLYSKSVTARTQLNAPQQAQAAVITGTKIDSLSGDGTAQNQAIVVKAAALAPEAQIKLSVPDEDITIHYTLTEVGHVPTPEQTGTSPVIVDMPLDGVGEKHYVLTYHTAGVGFKPSASTTVYYKVLKEHTVTFDSKGGSEVPSQKILYGSKISPEPAAPTAPSGYTFRNWCIDEACTTAWDFASGTVTSDITLYAKWDPVGGVSYTVQHYQQNIDDDNYPTASSATQTLNGTAGTLTTATANAYAGFEPLPIEQKTITGDGSTVVEVKYKRKRITVTFKLAGGNIGSTTDDVPREGKFGATFTVPTNPTKDGYTFNGWNPPLPSPLVFPAANATYTAQWQEIPKPGMHIKEGISAEEKSYGDSGTDDLVPDAGQYTNATPLIIYKESGQAKLSITGSSGTTAYYRIDAESETEKTEISLPADGSAHKLTVWAKKGADDSIKTVLHVQVKDALTTYKELKNVVKHADDGAVINIGNELNCTEESSEIEINKTLTVQRKAIISAPPRYIIDANEKGRFFKVASEGQLTLKDLTLKNGKMSGSITTGIGGGIQVLSGGTCQLTNCIITECKAVNGGALIVAGMCTLTDSIVENNSFLVGGSAAAANVMAAGTLVLEGNTVIKDNKTADGNPDAMAVVITGGITLKDSAQVKAVNNIHLSVETAYITVDENLAASPTAAGVSMPSFSAGRKVLAGTLTPDNIGKFTLVGFYAEQWKINASGALEAVGGQSQVVNTWEALRTAVQDASDGAVIEIANELMYDISDAVGKESIIKVTKDITIKSTEGNKYTLNANGKGADNSQSNVKSTGIFEVNDGKTLTLENVILTKTEKYAVYVAENGSLKMKNVTIKDCKTEDNAAGIYFNKGKDLILENCRIEKCKGKGSQSSGGIDIQAPKETVSIKDTPIENCEAEANGGGINLYNNNSVQCKLENVTVNNCSALRGGGLHVKAGMLTITGGSFTKNSASGVIANGGGGAIYSEGTEITITECTIGDDDTSKGNYAVQGGGIFVNSEAKCILKAGTKISGNTAMQMGADDGNGGGIFVNRASSGTAAGILTIEGTETKHVIISGNTADYGGGLYNFGKVTIKNAKIEKNEVPHHGGGMVNAGTCTMDSVKLENNKAGSEGGGIYSSKVLTLKDTTVTGNEATMSGGAIQIATADSVFNMSGSTVITVEPSGGPGKPSKNDIYLTNTAFITLTGALTAAEKIARITLNSSGGYQENRVVVKGGDGFTDSLSDYKNKFTITDKISAPKKWKLIYQSKALKLKQN